ncbi:MAG: hypothetical protein QNJ47_03585 [Nostocaceae cyanobacterium]|nr:hypothetical protein [Nostocaceae cyanobacterium]
MPVPQNPTDGQGAHPTKPNRRAGMPVPQTKMPVTQTKMPVPQTKMPVTQTKMPMPQNHQNYPTFMQYHCQEGKS